MEKNVSAVLGSWELFDVWSKNPDNCLFKTKRQHQKTKASHPKHTKKEVVKTGGLMMGYEIRPGVSVAGFSQYASGILLCFVGSHIYHNCISPNGTPKLFWGVSVELH